MKLNEAQKILEKIRIAPQDEIDQAQFHVCGDTPNLPGCKTGACALCGRTIYFNEHHPKLKKVCMPCAMPKIMADPDPDMITSSQGLMAMLEAIRNENSKS